VFAIELPVGSTRNPLEQHLSPIPVGDKNPIHRSGVRNGKLGGLLFVQGMPFREPIRPTQENKEHQEDQQNRQSGKSLLGGTHHAAEGLETV
jgi:hypothetical protein